MYEFLVLGQLSRHPMHGYMIARIIGDIIGPFRKVQWGALYPVLTRLEQQEMIRSVDTEPCQDGRTRKVYEITETGRARLHDHLMDTVHHIGEYDAMFLHKVSLLSELDHEERVYLLRHYAVHAQQSVNHFERERRDFVENVRSRLTNEQREDVLMVMEHRIDYWKHECEWAKQLLTRELTKEAVSSGT